MYKNKNLFSFVLVAVALSACSTATSVAPANVKKTKTVADCTSVTQGDRTPERHFECKDFKGKTFSATCNLAVDPVEFGIGAVQIEKAKWSKYGNNEGIEGKFGFITCQKQEAPSTAIKK